MSDTAAATEALPVADVSARVAELSIADGLAILPSRAPGWLCLDRGALPGMHPVITLCDGDHLLVLVPDAAPLAGFVAGTAATVIVTVADGSRLRAAGEIGPLDRVHLASGQRGETDTVLVFDVGHIEHVV